ncbi:hypothetical protein SDC9_150883 [bioreactor metagenome]|uniref:Uncharacterized protein n=1 Tax=bioreactor metagenome TaxID=1076179 RepID=A0A645EQW5_9ZZZZ
MVAISGILLLYGLGRANGAEVRAGPAINAQGGNDLILRFALFDCIDRAPRQAVAAQDTTF